MTDVAALVGRFDLQPATAEPLVAYARILAEDEFAPTTVRDPRRILNDHLADALTGLQVPELQSAASIADLGSGAGVPGIPLAIALPGTHVYLLEGNARKCEFMSAVVSQLALANVTVVHGRAETWRAPAGGCEVVTARALAALDIVEEYAAPLLRLGGVLVVWRGKREPEVEQAGARAAEILGLQPRAPLHVEPYPGAEHRHLHVYTKAQETPARFPRRDGVARKRPLGRS